MKKFLLIVLATILMLTFSVGALAQDMNSISALEQEHLQELSLHRSDIVVVKNGELRMACKCGKEMKLLERTNIETRNCELYEVGSGIKDSAYLYSYECQSCTQTEDYEKTICNH